MGSTFYSLHYHIVFSTKDRRPMIRNEWCPRLYEYLGGTVRGLGGVAEAVGGVDDHVLLVSLNTTQALADFVRELKKASSVWTAENHQRSFMWQEGYAVFTGELDAPIGRPALHRQPSGPSSQIPFR